MIEVLPDRSLPGEVRNIQDRADIDASHIQKLLADSEASIKLNEDTNVRVGDIVDGQKASADLEKKHFAVSQLNGCRPMLKR